MIGYGFVGKRVGGKIVCTSGGTWLPIEIHMAGAKQEKEIVSQLCGWFEGSKQKEIAKLSGVDGFQIVETLEEFWNLEGDYLLLLGEEGRLQTKNGLLFREEEKNVG